MTAAASIPGTDQAMIFTFVEPPRPDGGPRLARADLVEFSVEIDEDGARDVGRRIVHSGMVLLDDTTPR